MTSGPGLRWQIQAEQQRVLLQGEITEETDFAPLAAALGSTTILDLAEEYQHQVEQYLGGYTACHQYPVMTECPVPVTVGDHEVDHGDGILSASSAEEVQQYYDLVKNQ